MSAGSHFATALSGGLGLPGGGQRVAEGWQRQRRVMAAMAALPVAATAIAAAVLTDVQYSAGGAGGSWARTSALNFAWGPLR